MNDDGTLNTDVSYDGTWLTHSHRSHIGSGIVMDMVTGFGIDFSVLSNFCKACSAMKKKKIAKEFQDWKENV